jgi:hypothetical protein
VDNRTQTPAPIGLDAGVQPRSTAPRVEGYTLGRLLGAGASSQVWTGVDTRTGRTVALKVLTADLPRREAAVQRRVDHPHVLRVLRTTTTDDDRPVLVTEHAAGGSLAALVAARGPLDPGEVVTVLTPLAGALADLHERGVVHGDVSAANVLFLADGRPVLADLGTAGLLGLDAVAHGTPGFADPALAAGAAVSPAGDVHALGALGWFALTGQVPEPAGSRPPLIPVAPATPPALASLVERALDPEPRRRPSAAELAVQVFGTAGAAPVRLVPIDPAADAGEVVTHRLRQAAAAATPDPEPAAAAGRRRLPLLVTLGALVAAVVAAGASGMLPDDGTAGTAAVPRAQERSAPAPTATTPSAAMTPTATMTPTFTPALDDLAAVVTGLSDLRARGFAGADEEPLREANAQGSGALAADLATLADLDAQQVRLDGLTFAVSDVEVLSQQGPEAVVALTVVTGAHRVVADDGTVLEQVAASDPARVELVLARSDGRWRVSEVR